MELEHCAPAPRQRRVLMMAYVFPPFFSVGGSIRMVKFLKYLPSLGWLPSVLTIDDRTEYDTQRKTGSEALLREVPPQVKVHRTGAGEPSAAFLEKGREARRRSRVLAPVINFLSAARRWASRHVLLPDEKITWLPHAVRYARQIVRDEGSEVFFATCPPHSDAIIGAWLKPLLRRPFVLDYRDDWIDTPWFKQKPALSRFIERRLEKWAVGRADRVTLVTEWSRDAFVARYPGQPAAKFVFIPNGVDLAQFAAPAAPPAAAADDDEFTIVHAGLLSIDEGWHRSPEGFFTALKRIADAHPDIGQRLNVAFTGSLPEEYLRLADDIGVRSMVKELGHLPGDQFLGLLRGADLLLAINYDDFATLVPGKIYEYWAAGNAPIFLLSCDGAAQSLLARKSLGWTALPTDVDAIEARLLDLYNRKKSGDPARISTDGIEEYDRAYLARRLAALFTEVADEARH